MLFTVARALSIASTAALAPAVVLTLMFETVGGALFRAMAASEPAPVPVVPAVPSVVVGAVPNASAPRARCARAEDRGRGGARKLIAVLIHELVAAGAVRLNGDRRHSACGACRTRCDIGTRGRVDGNVRNHAEHGAGRCRGTARADVRIDGGQCSSNRQRIGGGGADRQLAGCVGAEEGCSNGCGDSLVVLVGVRVAARAVRQNVDRGDRRLLRRMSACHRLRSGRGP